MVETYCQLSTASEPRRVEPWRELDLKKSSWVSAFVESARAAVPNVETSGRLPVDEGMNWTDERT